MGVVLIKPKAIKQARRADALLGWSEGTTLLKMIGIWAETQDLELTTATKTELIMWSKIEQERAEQFLEMLVFVRFLRKKSDGVFYICGNKREVERVRSNRKRSEKGGVKKRVVQPRDGATKEVSELPKKFASGNNPSLDLDPGLDPNKTNTPLTPRLAGGSKKIAITYAAEAVSTYFAVADLAREGRVTTHGQAFDEAQRRMSREAMQLVRMSFGSWDHFARDCEHHAQKRKMASLERRLTKNFTALLDAKREMSTMSGAATPEAVL